MRVSKSGYYTWLKTRVNKIAFDVNLEDQIRKIHTSSRGTYGRRRVLSTLRKSFIKVGRKKVSKIMHKLNLYGVGKAKFKKTTKVSYSAVHSPDLLTGDFTAYQLNQVYTSDITYIPTKEGWVYLCVILDVFSRAIRGWSMQDNLKKELVLNSLDMAFKKRSGFSKGTIFHSDKGSQYTSSGVRKFLKINTFHQSMSNSCYENSITETFFATLKKELVHRCNFSTRKEAKCAIMEFIEVFYNKLRAHSALDYLSPMEYETKYDF